jgi:tetratricopeptide (TPR) repeat protein
LKQGRELIRKQKYAEAISLLQKVHEQDPKDEDALELLGIASFLGKQFECARDAFEELTQLNSGHTQAWVNLGAVLNRMGEHKKAADSLRRAIQKDRKCAEGYYNLGIAQRGLGLNTMAISAYKEAIKIKPDLIEAHLNLGNIYVDMKNLGLALQCFQTALRHDPTSKKAKSSLEKAQASQKDARKVTSPFGRLVNVDELEKQQATTEPRQLSADARAAERELVQGITKKVRAAAKELVPLLDDALNIQLHRLQRIVLQDEGRLSSSEPAELFAESLANLQRLKATISDDLRELRQQIGQKG